MGWSGDRRRGVDDFEGMFPGGVELERSNCSGSGSDMNFWAKSALKIFRSSRSSFKAASWSPLVMSDIQWLMGGAGLEVVEAVVVGVLSAEVRFRTWVPSEGNEQPRQVCLKHGVCLVQVPGFSC